MDIIAFNKRREPMDALAFWSVAVGICAVNPPVLELKALSRKVALPSRASDRWDAIGTFTIKEDKATTIAKLYFSDSDSIAEKVELRGGFGIRMYPNSFSIHAIYRQENGPWKHKELFGAARVGFLKVADVRPDAVTLEI